MPSPADNPRLAALLRLLSAALLLALAACSDQRPAGQVIATVEGTEITLAELNEEARSRSIDIARHRAARDALIRELVERKLLVREAEARQLERSPQYLLAERRMREILLGQQLLAGAAREQGNLSEPDLRRFVAANAHAFDGRQILLVEVAALSPTLPPPLRQALVRAPDRPAMERLLAAAGVKASWATEEWDSAGPPVGLTGWPMDETFLLQRGGGIAAGRVVVRTPQPVPAGEQLALARTMIERQRAEAAMTEILGKAVKGADISYQKGFEPSR